jgi:hypothetical protein
MHQTNNPAKQPPTPPTLARRTLPEPPGEHGDDRLLRRRDVASENALRFAGYNTRADRVVRGGGVGGGEGFVWVGWGTTALFWTGEVEMQLDRCSAASSADQD